MPAGLGTQIIVRLKQHSGFIGFFVMVGEQFAGLANCNLNFSTFQAKLLINIHDFIVASEFRNIGAARYLLHGIIKYASENGYCRINL